MLGSLVVVVFFGSREYQISCFQFQHCHHLKSKFFFLVLILWTSIGSMKLQSRSMYPCQGGVARDSSEGERPGHSDCEWSFVGVYGGGVMCVVARSCYDVMQIEMYGSRQSASLLTVAPCQPVTVPTTEQHHTVLLNTHTHTHHPDSSTLSLQAKTQQTFQTGRVIPPCVLLAMGWIGYEAFLRPHSVVTTSLLDFKWSEHFGLNSFLPLYTKKKKEISAWIELDSSFLDRLMSN